MKDELKKLGLQVRPRIVTPRPLQPSQPGHIAFDDRGNAIYEWENGALLEEGEEGERARKRALAHPGLAIVEDEGPGTAPIRANPKGTRLGYNPYESGLLTRKSAKKRDLRELSKWMQAKKHAKRDGQEE